MIPVLEHIPSRVRNTVGIVFAGLGLSCVEAPLAPVLPTSDVQLSVPLLNRTKYVFDFASKDTSLKETTDGSYLFEMTQAFDPLSLDTVKLEFPQKSETVELGMFLVDPPGPLAVAYSYAQMGGTASPSDSVPAGNLTVPATAFGPLSNMEFVAFNSGTVTLRVVNNMPASVQFPNPFVLRNDKTGNPLDTSVVATFSLAGITLPQGLDTTVSSSVGGVLMQNLLRLKQLDIYTPGTGGAQVNLQSAGIQLEITFSNFAVDSARAAIPVQGVYSIADSVYTVDDSTWIDYASLKSGSFEIMLENQIDADITVSVGVNELRSKATGLSFSNVQSFTGRGTATISFIGADYFLDPANTGFRTDITFSVGINTLQSQGFRTLRSTDIVRAEYRQLSPFKISRLTGRAKPTTVSLSTGASGADLGDVTSKFKGSFAFDSIKVALGLSIPQGFPFDYDLRLVAMNRKVLPVKIDSLDIPAPVGSGLKRIFPNSPQQIFLDNTNGINTFLEKFFPNLPDTFIVRGSVTVNPPDVYATAAGVQTVYDTSKVYPSLDVAFPLKIRITNGEVADTVDLGDKEKFPKDVTSSTRSGTMYFEVTNSLPFTLSFRAALVGNTPTGRDTLLFLPTIGSQLIAPPTLAPDGTVSSPQTTIFSISLSGPEMEKVNASDAMWYGVQIETSAGSQTVKLRKNDYVQVKASANLVYTINRQ